MTFGISGKNWSVDSLHFILFFLVKLYMRILDYPHLALSLARNIKMSRSKKRKNVVQMQEKKK